MEITEVRVKLMPTERARKDKLRAFCSVTFDNAFVVRDLKIIDGVKGIFVAMPSRKLMTHCRQCGCKNPVRSRFCNDCGKRIGASSTPGAASEESRRLFADIAHPIHAEARRKLHRAVVEAYERETSASEREGYVPPKFDDLDYEPEPGLLSHTPTTLARGTGPRPVEKPPSSDDAKELGASG